MGLTLKIENETQLPDGGPLVFRLTGARGADIGRDSHLDWTLPDPSRFVSGKHCEIRFREGGYWLSDVSTNGTFLNDGDRRMQSPYRLRSGDRLTIGRYIIAVDVEEAAQSASPSPAVVRLPFDAEPEDLWGGTENVAPPVDPRDLRPPSQSAPVRPDFLEWAVDVPNSPGSGFVARQAAPPARPAGAEPLSDALDWDTDNRAPPPPPEAPSPVPTPRRSIWINPGPAGPWDAAPSPAVAADPLPPPTPEPAEPIAPPPRPASPARSAEAGGILQRFAKGAGIPAEALATTDPGALAERLGGLMRVVADNLKQLLAARSQTKRMARSGNQTMIQALDNNPLKFSPSASEALRVMFGPQTGSYLDADKALQQSFDDLKSHQIKTFSAMQHALQMLIEDLDPKALDQELGKDQGLAAVLGSRKTRLWDLYEARWKAKTKGREGGLLELYLSYFAECYDRDAGRDPT